MIPSELHAIKTAPLNRRLLLRILPRGVASSCSEIEDSINSSLSSDYRVKITESDGRLYFEKVKR